MPYSKYGPLDMEAMGSIEPVIFCLNLGKGYDPGRSTMGDIGCEGSWPGKIDASELAEGAYPMKKMVNDPEMACK